MDKRHPVRSWILIGLLAALFSAAPIGASGPGAGAEPVTLEIANGAPDSELRCQLVLAHFVTADAATVRAGGTARVELLRQTGGGTLLVPRGAGQEPMAVENVICGLDGDWAATRNDVVLARLRDGSRDRLLVVCDGSSCRAVPGEN